MKISTNINPYQGRNPSYSLKFSQRKHTQQIEDFAKRVRDFMRPLCNVVSMELLRVNAKVRKYEKTNLKRKLRLIKVELNNLIMFIVVLYNTIEH